MLVTVPGVCSQTCSKPRLQSRLQTRPASPPTCPAVRVVAKKLGWVEVGDDQAWEVCWTDTSSGTDRLMRLRRPQASARALCCRARGYWGPGRRLGNLGGRRA